jgi:quercetin dioxygenase-like cupin family protein
MKITRAGQPTTKGSTDWFTGDVYVDSAVVPEGDSHASGGLVHFTPGARTAWHTHPFGQTIYVLEGIGRCQQRGGHVTEIRPGDRVFFEPGEEHWHGASPDRFMVHLAILQTDDSGTSAIWGDHVTDDDYLSQLPAE